MPTNLFQPGNPGKQPGTKNKPNRIKEFLKTLLEENFDKIQEDFQTLKPRERLIFIADILPYCVPKLQSIDLDAEITEKKIIITFGGNGSNGINHSNTESKELSATDN